jgi:hypothetical protein
MKPKLYDNFVVTIGKDNSIRASWRHGKEIKSSEPYTHPSSIIKKIKRIIDRDTDLINNRDLKEIDYIKVTGGVLFGAIFQDGVKNLFETAIDATDSTTCLRLIFDIDEDAFCFSWPLEFMYYESKDMWLATTYNRIAFSRRPFGVSKESYTSIEPPLRLLVIVSRPGNPDALEVDSDDLAGVVAKKVIEEIAQLGDPANLEIKIFGQLKDWEKPKVAFIEHIDKSATLENLQDLMEGPWKPNVIHFIGHGRINQKKGELCLVHNNKGPDWCSSEQICNLFVDNVDSELRLVILQSCWGVGSGKPQDIIKSSVGTLVRREIPAVIGMQFDILSPWAAMFASEFYRSLRDGLDLDTAVSSGRYKVLTKSLGGKDICNRDFGCPVLFTYNPECLRFKEKGGSGKSTSSTGSANVIPGRFGGLQPKDVTPIGMVCDSLNKALEWLDDDITEDSIKLAQNELNIALDIFLMGKVENKEYEKKKIPKIICDAAERLDPSTDVPVDAVKEMIIIALRRISIIKRSLPVPLAERLQQTVNPKRTWYQSAEKQRDSA